MTSRYLICLSATLLLTAATFADAAERDDLLAELGTVDRELRIDSDDPALRFRRTQLLGYLGRDDEALSMLDELRLDYPRDVDYSLARARALSRTGRDREALEELALATRLAPDYEEVWRLRYSILQRHADSEEADELRSVRLEAAVRFPGADWWQPSPEQAAWTVSIGTQFDSLSDGFPDWNNQYIEVDRRDASIGTLSAWLWRNERETVSEDFAFGFGVETRWSDVWFGGGELTVSDQPDFLPELSFSVHAGRTFDLGWVVDARYWRREYASATVDAVITTVERYVGQFRFAYSLSLSQLDGDSTSAGHVAAVNWYYDDASNIGITLTTGQEVESIGAGQVLETDVRGATLTGRHGLNERISLQWWLGTHDQGDFYRRQFVGMAVSIGI